MPEPAAAPPIAFAIPYYAGLRYLREAIDSVLAQTVDDWELVVVEDAGPEPAGDLVASYDDDRIRYVRNDHTLGLAGNWNRCVREVRAPLVTLLHGDDRLRPTYAVRVTTTAAAHPGAAAVFTGAAVIGPDGAPTWTVVDAYKGWLTRRRGDHVIRDDRGLTRLVAGNYIVCPTVCMRREVVGDDPFEPRWRFVTDWAFTCEQVLRGHELVGLEEPLLDYRRHPEQVTSVLGRDASRFEEELAFLHEIGQRTEARGWTATARAARRRVTVRAHLALSAARDVAHGRLRQARATGGMLAKDMRG
jgi:glycosyltransferase involved in cell wall biosynthesis